MSVLVCTFACAVIEGKEDPGDEASSGIAAMPIDSDVAQGSPIWCAGHVVSPDPPPIAVPAAPCDLSTRLATTGHGNMTITGNYHCFNLQKDGLARQSAYICHTLCAYNICIYSYMMTDVPKNNYDE